MPIYYDDNFGQYDIDSEDDIRFYRDCQRNSVRKKCSICGRTVGLLPNYDKCNSCVTILEQGGDPYAQVQSK